MQHDPQAHRAMTTTLSRQGRGRPWIGLLSAVLQLAGPKAQLVRHGERHWASVTFSGTRHSIVLRFGGEDALEAGDRFVENLPEHEFTIRGQIVADATVVAVDQVALPEPGMTVEAEILLLEDA